MIHPRSGALRLLIVAVLLLAREVTAADALEKTTPLGPVSATVRLEPKDPVIGDLVEFTVQVIADPMVEVLMPEFQDGLDRFRILSWAPKEWVEDDGRTVFEQRYALEPPSSGEQSIPPILIEFVDRRPNQQPAPEGEDAYELMTERLDFEVESVLPTDVQVDLAPPLGQLKPLAPPTRPRWPWVVGALAVLAVASPFIAKGMASWRRLRRRKSAYEIASGRLERLLAGPRPTGEAIEPFFVELSSIVRQYLEDRFELRAPELTTEEFLEVVTGSPDVTVEHQRLLRGFLKQADLVKFAHSVPADHAVEECITSARLFLDETREHAPLLETEEPSDRHPEKAKELSRV